MKNRIIRRKERFVSEDVDNDLEKGWKHEVDECDEMSWRHFEFWSSSAWNVGVEEILDWSCDSDFFFTICFGSTTAIYSCYSKPKAFTTYLAKEYEQEDYESSRSCTKTSRFHAARVQFLFRRFLSFCIWFWNFQEIPDWILTFLIWFARSSLHKN